MPQPGEHKADREARRFFGGKVCILTDVESEVDWHHLDENHSNWTATNIVPLCPTLNKNIERTKDPFQPIETALDLGSIAARSRVLFHRAAFRPSYGASRLGAFLAHRRREHSRSLGFAQHALVSLRSAPDVEFFKDTLQRSVLPLLAGAGSAAQIGRFERFVFANEIASWLRDYGDSDGALAVRSSPAAHLDSESRPPGSIHESRAVHGLASVLMNVRRYGVEHLLEEAEGLARDVGFAFGVSNALVTRVHLALRLDRLDAAITRLKIAEEFCGGISRIMDTTPRHDLVKISWWMAAELLGLKAEIDRRRGKRNDGMEFAHKAVQIYQTTSLRPRANAFTQAMREFVAELPLSMRPTERRPVELEPVRTVIDSVIKLLGSDIAP